MAASGVSIGSMENPFDAWSEHVLVALAAMAAPLSWLAPQGLAVMVALMGAATLPGLRPRRFDATLAVLVAGAMAWLLASTLWGPYPLMAKPMTGLKVAALVPLGVSLVGAGRRAGTRRAWSLPKALICSSIFLAMILLVEALTAGGLFRGINGAIGISIRPDRAVHYAARGTYALVVLGPAAISAGVRAGAAKWLAPALIGSLLISAHVLDADAPIVALFAAMLAAGTVWKWPRAGPLALAAGSSVLVLATPLLIFVAEKTGRYEAAAARLPLSWAERMSYWRFAVDRISEHPFRGWGMDASRTMAPGLVLHPHNGALQLWLELGLPGALLGAALCGGVFLSLSRPTPEPGAVTGAATAAAYLTIGLVSFGIWQEWWISLGLIAASLCAALHRRQSPAPSHGAPPTGADLISTAW